MPEVPPPPAPHPVQRTIQKEKRFSCDHPGCVKRFTRNWLLTVHRRTHTGETPYACDHPGCGKCFTQRAHLAVHKRKHSGEKPYACDRPGCDASFAESGHLKTHMRTHAGEKPYVCNFPGCSKRFAHDSSLAKHNRAHTGEKPYACNHPGCDATFARSYILTVHMRKHTGEKPYACDYPGCGAMFTTSGKLNVHKRSHTGERPFTCAHPGCEASFAEGAKLLTHMRIHAGERPFACDYPGCDARFAQKCNLDKHKRCMHTARGQQRQKKKEERVARFLTDSGVTYEREVVVNFCGEAERRLARVDFTVYRTWGTDVVECDEEQHRHYPIGCDAGRMLNVFAEIMKRGDRAGKLRFIRFNPDAYKLDGEKQQTLQRDRQVALLRVLNTEPEQQFSVVYLFYDRTGPLPDVCLDAEYPSTLRAIASVAD